MEDTKLKKEEVMDAVVGIGIIFVTALVAYSLGVRNGEKQYQKTIIRLARKHNEIWRIVDKDHRLTVTYF